MVDLSWQIQYYIGLDNIMHANRAGTDAGVRKHIVVTARMISGRLGGRETDSELISDSEILI